MSTSCLSPLPTITALTFCGVALPLAASAAMTRSPGFTWLIGLREPSAISTGVSAVKLFGWQVESGDPSGLGPNGAARAGGWVKGEGDGVASPGPAPSGA